MATAPSSPSGSFSSVTSPDFMEVDSPPSTSSVSSSPSPNDMVIDEGATSEAMVIDGDRCSTSNLPISSVLRVDSRSQWTENEVKLLREAVSEFGRDDFKGLSQFVESKNPKEIEEFLQRGDPRLSSP